MRISVMLYSFSSALSSSAMSVADAIACCADAGAHGVEPMDRLVADLGVGELNGLLGARNLTVPCCDMSADLVQDDAEGRRQAASKLSEEVRRAGQLRAPVALIVPGGLRPGIERPAAIARAAEGIRSLLGLAESLGMTLTVEQMGSQQALCTRGEHMRAMVEAVNSPHFGLTYDPGNFYLTGEECVKPLRELLPWVRHVHFKDIKLKAAGGWTSVPLGTGEVPLNGVHRALAEGGYDGYISVEYESADDPCGAVRAGIAFVQRLIAS